MPLPILTKFRMKYYLVLMHLRTKIELDNSKFAQVTQFGIKIQKIQNHNKFERSNRFWQYSIPKVLDRYIMTLISRFFS